MQFKKATKKDTPSEEMIPVNVLDRVCREGFIRTVLGINVDDCHTCIIHTLPIRVITYKLSSTTNHNPSKLDDSWCMDQFTMNGYRRCDRRCEPRLDYKPYTAMPIRGRTFKYLYVLSLEDNKWYVGITNNVQKRFDEHLNGKGSKWTAVYKPIKVVDKYEFEEPLPENFALAIENRTTLKLQEKYGAEKVRGGNWTTV